MSRPATVWWNKQRGAWCTDIGGARRVLAKGKANKKLAKDKLKELLDEQALLADVDPSDAPTLRQLATSSISPSVSNAALEAALRLTDPLRLAEHW